MSSTSTQTKSSDQPNIPLLAELGCGQHSGGEPGTMGGRVGVHGTDNDLDLGVNTGNLIS